LNIGLVIPLVIAGFAVLFISIALLEKQPIREFAPAPPGSASDGSPYFNVMNEAAARLGFQEAGVYTQHRGNRVYKARVAMWVSPDQETLLRVGGGTTAGIPIRRTILTSFFEPGRILETSDDFSMVDLSGSTDREVVLNADLDELVARHQARLASCPGPRRPFSAKQALPACEAMQAMKAVRMESLGLGRFLNPERTVWRHTLKGAVLSYQKGFLHQLRQGQAQKDRVSKKRPGEK
jgi:hypothetical protein